MTLLRWDDRVWMPTEEPGTTPDVVDSWLQRDGHVDYWHLHKRRFGHAGFMDAAVARVCAEGWWFPRVEKHGDVLYLRVRPAPALRTETVLWIPATPDPRRRPRVKGPDLEVLRDLREQAQGFGADDALLWTADGLVAEGAHCAVSWWEDGRLMVPEHPDQLPSTTVAATRQRREVDTRPITVEELRTFPVWAGSALHGWTRVVGWVGPDGRRGQAEPAAGELP